jgi:uncharacterized membrane protein YccC
MTSEAVPALRRWLIRHRSEMVHAIRITAASASAYALVWVLGLSGGLWAVITAIIVTQSSLGGSLKVASDQLVGSMFGAIYATAIAVLISPGDQLTSTIALIAALAPLSILAAFFPGFRIAPITGAIMLLGGAGSDMGPLSYAVHRILAVGLGCGVGILISMLVVPARASRSVLEITGQVADLLAQELGALAAGNTGQVDIASLAARSRISLIHLGTSVEEAARERRSGLTDLPDGEPLLRIMRRLRHDVSMLRRAAREAGREIVPEQAAKPWLCAIEAGVATLRETDAVLSGRGSYAGSGDMAQAVRDYRIALYDTRRAGPTHSFSTAALGRLFGIGFALDQFRRDLDDLIEVSRKFAASRHRHEEALSRTVPEESARQAGLP